MYPTALFFFNKYDQYSKSITKAQYICSSRKVQFKMGAGLKLRMINIQKNLNFDFLRDDSEFISIFIYRCIKNRKLNALKK